MHFFNELNARNYSFEFRLRVKIPIENNVKLIDNTII